MSIEHNSIPAGEQHVVANWQVASVEALDNLTVTAADIGKQAWVRGTGHYTLANSDPITWERATAVAVSGTYDVPTGVLRLTRSDATYTEVQLLAELLDATQVQGRIDIAFAESAANVALTAADVVTTGAARDVAVAAQLASEVASAASLVNATAALASGKIYTTTAFGIAATTSGQCFLVTTYDTQVFNLYSNVATVATLLGQFSILSKARFEAIFDSVSYEHSGWIDAVVDGSTPPRVLHGMDTSYLWKVYVDASFLGTATFVNLAASGATYGGQAVEYVTNGSQSGYQYAVIGGSGKNLLAVAEDGTLEALPRPVYIDGSTYCLYDAPDTSLVRQVYLEHKTTGVITKLSTGGGNNFNPRFTADSTGVIWTTDRRIGAPPRNLLWSLISAASERPVFSHSNIACWGDSLTQGTGASTAAYSYPSQLGALFHARAITNNGIASQRSLSIAARQGGVAVNILFPSDTIQASGGATVTCDSNPLQYASTQVLYGTVAGVYGKLSISGSTYTWTRKDAGSTVALSGATLFVVDNGLQNAGLTILWVGRNDVTIDAAVVLANIASMVANLQAMNKHYIVMSILNSATEPSGSSAHTTITATNATLSATYGNKYVDIRSILVAAYDVGIPADVTAHGLDKVPPSLQSDDIHLNDAGYAIVATTLQTKITTLGW